MSVTQDKIRVLVIEDDELDRMIIKKALKGSNFETEIVFAEDMDSGLSAASENNFDCIFIDYNLPGGNGLELLIQIRAAGNNSPVIIVTSQGDERIAVELMKNGATDYIPKSLLTTEGMAQILRQIFRLRNSETEKVRLEKAFLATQKTLQTVVANSPIILFSIDANGVLTMLEGKGIEGFDLNRKTYLTKEASGSNNTLPVSETAVAEALKGKEVKEISERIGKFFEVFYTPIRNDSDEITGVMGVATDITGFKKTEVQLTNEKIIAEETSRIKQEFLANMSHEIRTPMNGIIGIADILSKTKITNEQRKYLQSIISCSENLLYIINDILDLSKIESGKMTFEKMPFSLNEVIDNTLMIFSREASAKNIKLTVESDKKIPKVVSGDYVRLSQVLNNLIGNAIKFTSSGEVNLSVQSVNETRENVTLIFKVKDSGIGIPKEKLQTIFESFTQGGSDTTRKFGGTGLGLTIVKKLLKMQGGTISVESAEGVGSIFKFTLPVNKVSAEKIKQVKEASTEINQTEVNNMNILVAEDNEMSRLIINKHFTDWKINFRFAKNGNEAVALVKANYFDLILMDIQMPVMDGYEATRQIRNELSYSKASVPIVAMTAHATDTERIKCMNAGMNDYLSKPFRTEELQKKIRAYSRNTASQSENKTQKKKTETMNENTLPVIDLNYLKRVAENEAEFIRDMIGIFLKRTPEALKTIRASLEEENFESVWQTAHRIKPTFSYMGMPETSALCAKLEKLCKTEPDKKQAEEFIETIETNYNIAQSLIEKEFLVTK
ncbi:MAG: response regulator [Bacteroidia bacterium]|nr:response regulator [Bacteroidia bacterium]